MTMNQDLSKVQCGNGKSFFRLTSWKPMASALAVLVAFPGGLLAAPPGEETMKPGTLARVKKAAVMVFTARSEREKGDTPLGSGSGFFINSTGLAMSNNHVVDPTHLKSPEERQQFHYTAGRLTWTLITDSGTDNEKTYDAMVLFQNEWADLAILQAYEKEGVKLKTPNYLPLLPESRLQDRLKVWALGFPGGDQQRTLQDKHPEVSITNGNVLTAPRTPGGRIKMVYTDVVARPGNSGGPMVEADGFLVGAVTLMKPPEGREDSGGANYSALVPARLAMDLIRYAFALGKIPAGSDITPFMDALTSPDGLLNIPEYARRPDQDVLYFSDGDRIYGDVVSPSHAWDSPMGKIEVPTSVVAYVMTNDEGSHVFMEGGNRITAPKSTATFKFKTDGQEVEQPFDKVAVIALRTGDRKVELPAESTYVLDTNVAHLILSDIEGEAPFVGKLGKTGIKFGDISRLFKQEDGQQVLSLVDGRRMTGKFEPGGIKAKIAATGTPIEISLANVDRANVEVAESSTSGGGLTLSGVLAGADPDIAKVARKLQTDDAATARKALDELLASVEFKKASEAKKEQARLLEAKCLLLEGKFVDAQKKFKALSKAGNANIGAYSDATVNVLKKYNDNKFNGKPLSDNAAFRSAGAVLGNEAIVQARTAIKDARAMEGERNEFKTLRPQIDNLEKVLPGAAIFVGSDADDEMIRLWKLGVRAAEREIARINEWLGEVPDTGGRGSGGNTGASSRLSAPPAGVTPDQLRMQREKAQKAAMEYVNKLFDYGFHIDDPDVQDLKEKTAPGLTEK